jgi:hypothetical protein
MSGVAAEHSRTAAQASPLLGLSFSPFLLQLLFFSLIFFILLNSILILCMHGTLPMMQ